MNYIKIIGLLTGLSIISFIAFAIINNIIVICEANDDVDLQDLEDEIFRRIQQEKGCRNA
ncbi:hypothetical protein ACWEXK_12305 [Staphylococcus xylosus]|uniref:hypothetical protein n=1 Tax=Staphylococcus xylosus TaxID=1288 RepID=UPI000D1E23A8|nr:hypothetical protein [Staphylococcus xylosus]PTI18323.1 hypothetical protein BU115_12130 [Staphylococcus xylosus]HDP5827266.1 hypothetical protein [Staphylococcus aureus]